MDTRWWRIGTLLLLALGWSGAAIPLAREIAPPDGSGVVRPLDSACIHFRGPWTEGSLPLEWCIAPGGGGGAWAVAFLPRVLVGYGSRLRFTLLEPLPSGTELVVEVETSDGPPRFPLLHLSGPVAGDASPPAPAPPWVSVDLAPFAGAEVEISLRVRSTHATEAGRLCVGDLELWGVSPGAPCAQSAPYDATAPATLATALSENFSAGIPATWTVVHGGECTGAAATWTAANPGNRTPVSPMASPFVIADSDIAGGSGDVCSMDEQLLTPVLNLSTASTASLKYDHFFKYYSAGSAEVGDVDVRSSKTGGAWMKIAQYTSTSANPQSVTLDITSQAAGASDAQVRFHYYNALWEYWWMVDNVKVEYVACPLPGAPAGVSATTTSCSNVVVTWTGGSGATSHTLLRYSGACPSAAGLVTFTGVTSPYADTTASAGSSYCYVVQAANSCGTTNSGSVTGTRLAAPAAPGAPALAPGCTSLVLGWTAVPGASTYDIWRAAGAGCSGATKINSSPVSGTSYGDTGLSLSTSYSYRLTASNACGTSVPGTCATTSTLSCSPNLLYQSNGSWTELEGNGNAHLDPGERWGVTVTLRNAGTLQATGAQATLSAAGVQVCNNPGAFGALVPGGTASATYIVAVSPTFAQDYGCGAAAIFALTGKTCSEASPAGPDETAAFSRTVGTPVSTPYARNEAGVTGTIAQNATTLFYTVNNPVTSVPDPLQACTVDITLTPPCNGLGTLTVRVEHDPGADGIYEYSQTVYSGPGTGWANLTGFSLGTMVDGTAPGNGRWRLSATHVRGLCTPGALSGWILHLQGLTPSWTCAVSGSGACSAGPKPVPDGRWVQGQPLKATKLGADGTSAHVTWDVSTCPAPGYNLYAGPLTAVSTYGYDTWSNCALGTTGQADVALSSGSAFFVVVPVLGGVEGSHGRTSAGAERPASGVGHCSVTAKEATATCP